MAIVANPVDYQLACTQAFDRQEGLDTVPNWLYLTGSPAQLSQVWRGYGILAQIEPAGSMIGHSEIAFAIDDRRAICGRRWNSTPARERRPPCPRSRLS